MYCPTTLRKSGWRLSLGYSLFDRNEHRKISRSLLSDSSSQFLQLSDWFLQADPNSIPAPQPSSDAAAPAFSQLDAAHVHRVSRRLHTAPSLRAPLPTSRSFAR